ncbi:MAG: ABC transporter substrate-binding protein, partial [Cryobacterium sp.]|nr:ABC transporter substrate-binding protein [Cryobacterium sp.]
LSGKAALSGANAKRSLDLAVKDINADGGILGKKVEVIYNDNQSTNPGAVNALNKTLSSDNVFAVIGPIRSTQILAMNETIQSKQVPMFIGGTNKTLTEEGKGLLFRFRPSDALTGAAVVSFAQDKFKPKKVAILHDSDAFGTGGAAVVEQAAAAAGMEVVQKSSYTTGDKDFTAQLSAIKSADPDVVFPYATNSEDLVIFARQIQELGIDAEIVGSPAVTSQVSFDLGQQYVQGWFAVVDFLLNATPANKEWATGYEQAYGTKPDLFGAWQHDAMFFAKKALEASGCDRKAYVKALREVEIEGVQGPLKSNERGDVNTNLYAVQVEGDKAVLVQKVESK